ncbi:unnamed protein product [Cochlearia groenlandica]
MKKKHPFSREAHPYPAEVGHEYAIGYMGYQQGIFGTHATMNVWAPEVEAGSDEFSLSQIWLVAGHYDGSDLNTIEADWQRDTYQNTGYLNLECPGFVQVSNEYAIGAAIAPDTDTGDWWLGIGLSLVGYWPSTLFTHLAHGPAYLVQWGTEVVNTHINGHLITTDMGSSHFEGSTFNH